MFKVLEHIEFNMIKERWQHYEKKSLPKPHCLTIRVPKQLIYNYTTIRAWKYEQLTNKMTCQNIREL
jgi:hypothetical protein